MDDEWVVTLGKKHGVRERRAVEAATAASNRDAEATKLWLGRWTNIVAAMTKLITTYNVSFDRNVLDIAEDRSDPDRPVATIQASGEGSPSLIAALEGTLICVRSRDGDGLSCNTERRLMSDRDDEQTAAYVLQPWLERL